MLTVATTTTPGTQVLQAAKGEQSLPSFFCSVDLEVISSCPQLSHKQQGTTVSASTMKENMKAKKIFTGAKVAADKKRVKNL